MTLNFENLYYLNHDKQTLCHYAGNLVEALKSCNCPSGLVINFNNENQTYKIDGKPLKETLYSEELQNLCADGKYDRINIEQNINNIYDTISKRLSLEIQRLKIKRSETKNQIIDPRETLLSNLLDTICVSKNNVIIEFQNCSASETWKWKDSLKYKLQADIENALKDPNINKKYTDLEKFGRRLLNIITGMLFPLAIIKYATTGNAFYSTVGKTKEATEESLNIVKTIK